MKAIILEQPTAIEEKPLKITDLPIPDPGPDRVLVKVHACGICHTDLHQVEGELTMHKSPVVPGHQVVGTVTKRGKGVTNIKVGDRVGMAWLHDTCGKCSYCLDGRENLCSEARFTGYDVDGGYAEYTTVHEDFSYPIPEGFPDLSAAPLLCAGIIGYRSLRLSNIKKGGTLGLYGFGASAHVAIQVAKYWNCRIFVFSRGKEHRDLSLKLGAEWAGTVDQDPPVKIHSSIIFAPAGSIVPRAMEHLDKGGTLATAGIYMTPIPEIVYDTHLYHEKVIRSVANSTRRDGIELLELAAKIPIKTEVVSYPLEEAQQALLDLKEGRINGAAVLKIEQN
jgi:propanol-preferring alcohol dehydrogenase